MLRVLYFSSHRLGMLSLMKTSSLCSPMDSPPPIITLFSHSTPLSQRFLTSIISSDASRPRRPANVPNPEDWIQMIMHWPSHVTGQSETLHRSHASDMATRGITKQTRQPTLARLALCHPQLLPTIPSPTL